MIVAVAYMPDRNCDKNVKIDLHEKAVDGRIGGGSNLGHRSGGLR